MAQTPGRETVPLSGYEWKLTLDPQAQWRADELYVPPVNVASLPVNPPTGGWEALEKAESKTVHLPATVEQYFWGKNGETFGVTGNYTGVSWFTTKVRIPESWRGKRIFLDVESVRFRAEIFMNRKLCGYDLVNSTPFRVDVTEYAHYGRDNEIAFRITDPNGNFNWKDSQVYTWGDYYTNPSHGFGGITGRVDLTATDPLYVEDVFVKNRPKADEIDVQVTAANRTGAMRNAQLVFSVREHAGERKAVYTKAYSLKGLTPGETERTYRIALKDAKLWSVDEPNLYDLTVTLKDGENEDSFGRRFGFRWFEVRYVKGDRQFYLNGKRIVLRTAISWSFWPDNGIVPSDELARRQVASAKELGLNMLNFHRTIGQPRVLDWADELGLLYFEEPGGNQYPADRFEPKDERGRKQADFYFAYRNEKLTRMIRRDRNHPSLVIYNLHNERGAAPQAEDYRQMRLGHALDETRILTYNSSNGQNPEREPNPRFKLHLMPYDTVFYDTGWWDQHHAGGPGVYHDNLYRGKDDYHRFSNNRGEIVYWGEDGAIGTPPRLQLIRDEILKSGRTTGWEAADYLKWYDAYDAFLKERGFSEAFPSVDALTRAMGGVSFYYQGRIIENIRISNTVDAYAVNGWESMKLENHSGIVDNYRHPKGDPELIARYNRPLYVAVKLNHKVLGVRDTATADFYIVNEKNLRGKYTLNAAMKDADGNVLERASWPVTVTGGTTYGEPLHLGWNLMMRKPGYATVEAELVRGGETAAAGSDELFAVKLDASGIPTGGMVADTSGVLNRFLSLAGVGPLKEYRAGIPDGEWLLVGAFEPQQWGSGMSDIMEWVYKGHTLVVAGNAERWAEFLADKEVLDYRGAKKLGTSWYGGNFFVRKHPLFEGLPTDCAFNWEYQCFATYNRNRVGLRNFNGETVVGCVSDHKKEVYSALSVIPAGRGQVVLTTLDIFACLQDLQAPTGPVDIEGMNESMNTFNNSRENKANIVGQQLLLNLLKAAGRLPQW